MVGQLVGSVAGFEIVCVIKNYIIYKLRLFFGKTEGENCTVCLIKTDLSPTVVNTDKANLCCVVEALMIPLKMANLLPDISWETTLQIRNVS